MQIITVNLIVYNDKGEILIVKRSELESEGGMWSFPGGTVEQDECLAAALKREINEEIGLNITSCCEIKEKKVVYGERVTSHYYTCLIDEEIVIRLNPENSEFKWISPNNTPEMAYEQHNLISK